MPGSERLLPVCCLVVLFSVVLHGLSPVLLLPRMPNDSPTDPPGTSSIKSPPAGDFVTFTTTDEVRSMQRRNERIVVVDVRSERSYETSDEIIPGAVRLHPDRAVADAERFEVPRDATLVLLCA